MADPGSEVEYSQGGADQLRIEEADCRCQLSKFDDVTGSNETMKKALLHDRLGRILYGQVRFCEAEEQFTQALALCPDLAAALHNRATIKYRMGDLAAAEDDLARAQRLRPDHPEVAVALAETRRLRAAAQAQQHS